MARCPNALKIDKTFAAPVSCQVKLARNSSKQSEKMALSCVSEEPYCFFPDRVHKQYNHIKQVPQQTYPCVSIKCDVLGNLIYS